MFLLSRPVDIIAVFGFARIPGSISIPDMQDICDKSNTSLWIDMELFSDDMSQGLVPKDISAVLAEIRNYDYAHQIGAAYEFTGLMDSPSSRLQLGGLVLIKILFFTYSSFF
eukprot:m.99963 g.99963  ORF g.99963 m.99963 type:complete len:112 (+) comp13688_c0_seq2:72-407(+)